ncbi:GTP-binding protein [Streptomyces sp. NPDC048290]|uniref:GTP-binding protein n=1 Tax=Streptomyces sp. NPDC048290 TaxID=3155811 RepID=UPI003432055C
MSDLSVVIVGGLHADARRATVARLLADVPGSVVLHHDLSTAPAGTVVRTVSDATGVLATGETPLVNDCACCALREDLVPELARLARGGTTPLAIVELWDSVEPKAMAEVIASGGLRLTGVITAVDPALLLPYLGNGDDLAERGLAAAATDQRTVADTFARQLEYAPVLAVAESPETDDEDRELLTQLHPTARRVLIGHGGGQGGEGRPAPRGVVGPMGVAMSSGFLESPESPESPESSEFSEFSKFSVPSEPSEPSTPFELFEPSESSAFRAPSGSAEPSVPSRGPASDPDGTPMPASRNPGPADIPRTPLAAAAFAGFDVEAAATAQHPAMALLPAEADAHGVSTLVWHRRRPFHPERLYAALEDLTCAAARSRGRFWLADKPDTLVHWDAAGGALCVEAAGPWLASLPDAAWELVPPVRRAAAALDWHPEHGDCCQHLVFTSPGLDCDGLERLLESCLLTDAEYAAGRDAWKRLPPVFDTFLEV